MKIGYLYKKQIIIDYEAQLLTNQILNDKIKEVIN